MAQSARLSGLGLPLPQQLPQLRRAQRLGLVLAGEDAVGQIALVAVQVNDALLDGAGSAQGVDGDRA